MAPEFDTENVNQSVRLNLEYLDRICIDYLYFQGYIAKALNGDKTQCWERFQDCAEVLRAINGSLLSGDIARVVEQIQRFQPKLLQNQKFAFELYKQQYFQMLHQSGSIENKAQLLDLIQSNLSPFALTASPQSYEEFKIALLGMVWDDSLATEDNQCDAIQKERNSIPGKIRALCSPSRLSKLLSLVRSEILRSLKIGEPTFSLQFRYMALIHNMYNVFRESEDTKVLEVDSIMLPEREPFAMTETSLVPMGAQLQQSDVMLLAQTLGISPNDARRTLEQCEGSVDKALLAELSSIKLDHEILGRLVYEYTLFRKLIPTEVQQNLPLFDTCLPPSNENLQRYHQLQSLLKFPESTTMDYSSNLIAFLKSIKVSITLSTDVNLSPDWITADSFEPELIFRVKQLQVIEIWEAGNIDQALGIIRSELAPLTKSYPPLFSYLRTLLVLIVLDPSTPYLSSIVSGLPKFSEVEQIVDKLHDRISVLRNLQEPRLITMLKTLINVREKWFIMSGEPDRFEKVLDLHKLKTSSSSSDITMHEYLRSSFAELRSARSNGDIDTNSSTMNLDEVVDTEAEEDVIRFGISDESIKTVQEIMACDRSSAIRLLVDHDGDVNQVLASMFG